MSKYSALVKRVSNATAATALALASLTPAVMLGGTAKAGQMTERQILMSTSKVGTGSTYTVSFKPTASTDIKGIVVDFCEGSPMIGADCTDAMEEMVTPADASSVTVNGVSFTVDNASTQTGLVILTNGTGVTGVLGGITTISFDLSVTNEGGPAGTFYARVLTYSTTTAAAAYVDNSVGTYIDAGGVAMSTTNDMTINARVQEQLTFCAAALDPMKTIADIDSDATPPALSICQDAEWGNNTVDLGVLTSSATNTTPVPVAGTDGNDQRAAFAVTTNAYYGVKIYYSSPNSLKASAVAEGDCEDNDTNVTDQCINAAGGAASFPAVGTEKFGMSVTNFDDNATPAGEGTWTLQNSYGTGYGWNTTAQTEIARSSSVVVDDIYELTFKANAAATTPSGYYTTTANFVALATF